MNKLLKDAIADAKAVRETALAQAKLALEEAFAPKLQSMLSTKIREEMEEEPVADDTSMEDEAMRMKELAGLYEKGDEEMGAEEAPAEDEFSDDDMGGEDMGGEEDFGGEEEFSDDMGGEEEYSDDDELDEILRQLEEEESTEDNMEDESMSEGSDESLPMVDRNKENYGQGDGLDEEINLDELIQALKEGEDGEEEDATMDEVAGDEEYKKASDQAMDTAKGSHGTTLDERKKMKKMEEELNEAYTAVKFLREKLSEVNLLNAKLLYVNKLFRKNGLTESQKVKIIETFDRAKNVRETKLIYATLSESMNTSVAKTKKPVVENFASSPVKKTQVITEGNDQMNRFKKLAGIIKS